MKREENDDVMQKRGLRFGRGKYSGVVLPPPPFPLSFPRPRATVPYLQQMGRRRRDGGTETLKVLPANWSCGFPAYLSTNPHAW